MHLLYANLFQFINIFFCRLEQVFKYHQYVTCTFFIIFFFFLEVIEIKQ